jgi:hypothetical protein
MSRRLGSIAAAALAISAISFAAAVWIGDTELLDIGGPRGAMRGIACAGVRFIGGGGAPSSSRSETTALSWPDGGTVEINLPATVLYHPAPVAEASVSGDPDVIGHVRFEGGRLVSDGGFPCLSADRAIVHLAGPPPAAWRINGSGALTLTGLDQDTLAIELRGSARTEAEGRVRALSLEIAGSARADLRALMANEVHARIRGSGNADISPVEEADVVIAGSAKVTVHGHPQRLHSRVAGSGEIRQEP